MFIKNVPAKVSFCPHAVPVPVVILQVQNQADDNQPMDDHIPVK